jgi:putative ABC transport system permease protein
MILTYSRLALRNIAKNGRRSLVTISAIGLGFAALTLFYGYSSDVFQQLGHSAVTEEGLGHLTVYKRGWLEHGTLEPEKYLLRRDELERIRTVAQEIPGVVLASPKRNVAGLVSNGKVSTIFVAEGTVPEDHNALLRADGQPPRTELDPGAGIGVQMSEGLARLLDLEVGSTGMLSGLTLEGSMNAVNFEVTGTFNTGVPETNDKFIRMPLSLAQELSDGDQVDRVMVLLDSFERTLPVRDLLVQRLAAAGVDVEVKTWEERSAFYESTRGLLTMLLSFVGTIVLVIVVMSVVNTMGVSVLERTREIGTLRVLGLRQRHATLLFAIEGALLGLLGSAAGTLVHTLGWAGVAAAEPRYVPPGNSEAVLLLVRYSPLFLAGMALAMVAFSLLAAVIPARRAAKQNIVVSLGHV